MLRARTACAHAGAGAGAGALRGHALRGDARGAAAHGAAGLCEGGGGGVNTQHVHARAHVCLCARICTRASVCALRRMYVPPAEAMWMWVAWKWVHGLSRDTGGWRV